MTTRSPCGRSRSSTAWRGSGSATASGLRRSWPRSARSSAATTSARSPRSPRSRASTTRPRSSGGGPRTGSRSPTSRSCSGRGVSSRYPDSATNFVLVDVGADADAVTAALLAARGQRPVRDAVRGADLAADRCGLGGRSRAARRRSGRRRVQRGLTTRILTGAAGASAILNLRARGASFRMRTTLKRGVGRGHSGNGNGKMQLPPGPTAPVTIYRQPEPPRRSRSRLALSILGWALTVVVVCVAGVAGGAYLYAPRDGCRRRGPKSVDVKVTAKRLDLPIAGQPATALVIGYDRRADEAKGAPSRSDTLMLIRANPQERDDLAALVPARPARRDHLPGQVDVRRPRSTPPTRAAARAGRSTRCASSPACRSTT